MTLDSATRLRDWGNRLEQALGIPIVVGQSGALLLKTKGGHVFGVAAVPGEGALIFTGVIGVADERIGADALRALLAINLSATFSGLGFVGVEPETQEILFRLPWMPVESSWTEQAFAAVLAAFAEHVDALAGAVANGEIVQWLADSSGHTAARARHTTSVANLA